MPRSILIVDPDAFLAGMLARRFEFRHWKVRVVETVAEATRELERFVPDAVLMDPKAFPEAYSVLNKFKANPATASVKWVVLSNIGDRKAVARAYREGADAYLLKGHFVPSEVCDKVEALVAESAP